MTGPVGSVALTARRLWERQLPVVAVYGLAAGLFIATGLTSANFFRVHNVETSLVLAAFLGITALAQMFVLILGGIDLSLPWAMTMAAVVVAVEAPTRGLGTAMLIGLGLCVVVGLTNGIGVTYFRLSPIIMTLAMAGIIQGGVSTWAAGKGFQQAPAPLVSFAGQYYLGIPSMLYVWVGLAVLAVALLALTRYGRQMYAVGASPRVAFLSGVRVHSTVIVAYILCSLIAGLDGILISGYITQAYLGMGASYLFPSIAAAVVGGVSIYGGQGGYIGPIGGALALTFLQFFLAALGLATNSQQIVFGIVLLFAVSLPLLRGEGAEE